MGIARLIMLGAGMGVGVVGLDRALEGWQKPAALSDPLVSRAPAEPVAPLVALTSPGAPLLTGSTPSTARVARVGPSSFGLAEPSATEAARRYALVRPDASGYRVVEFRCVPRPMPDEAISEKLREALEAAEAARGS